MAAQASSPSECAECQIHDIDGGSGSGARLWVCIDCGGRLYCDPCWQQEPSHRRGRVNAQGREHEQTDPRIHRLLASILAPRWSAQQVEDLHDLDQLSMWFGRFSAANRVLLLIGSQELVNHHPESQCSSMVMPTSHSWSVAASAAKEMEPRFSLA